MANNWETYRDTQWFGTERQQLLDEAFHDGYLLGEDGLSKPNPFRNLPPGDPLEKDPDLLLGLQQSFDLGLKDGKKVKQNKQIDKE
jgi:hypothetical protein